MTWSDFYLICFAVGFCFSFFSFIFGGHRFGRMHVPHHLPHFGGHGLPHAPVAHGAPGSAPAAQSPAQAAGAGHSVRSGAISPFNPPTIAAFLAWFGGTGYLLARYSAIRVGFELLLSIAVGTIGGGIIFLFLSRVLISDEESMDPADYEMVGVLGKLSVSIRDGGTGELLYSQMGTRRVCGARSDSGGAIPKGSEVVVTRYEKGLAYVRLWSEMSGEQQESSTV